jgi:NTP pyrophosphatase (non-canonical NTP hydrolase)
MTFDEYQKFAKSRALYPGIGSNVVYPTLGLCGESGEFAEKVKKSLRDDNGVITDTRRAEMVKELGDVLWYLAMIADELGVPLSEVVKCNVEKINSRHERKVIHGSGDNR